ncbi:uncharacterized protein Dere_GG26925 [Drosophila erecta]|nr:uncharacterized protein Dere_GG26925 [Drosophila erecta]
MQLLNLACLKQKVAHIASNNNQNQSKESQERDPRDTGIFGCFAKKDEQQHNPTKKQSEPRDSSSSGSYKVQQKEQEQQRASENEHPSVYRQQDEDNPVRGIPQDRKVSRL